MIRQRRVGNYSPFIFMADSIRFASLAAYVVSRRCSYAVRCTFLVVGESEASERKVVTPPVTPRRRGDLQLVPPGLVLPAEPVSDHIRNALQLLNLAWSRVEELNLIGYPELADLLEGAEARLFRALSELEGQP